MFSFIIVLPFIIKGQPLVFTHYTFIHTNILCVSTCVCSTKQRLFKWVWTSCRAYIYCVQITTCLIMALPTQPLNHPCPQRPPDHSPSISTPITLTKEQPRRPMVSTTLYIMPGTKKESSTNEWRVMGAQADFTCLQLHCICMQCVGPAATHPLMPPTVCLICDW